MPLTIDTFYLEFPRVPGHAPSIDRDAPYTARETARRAGAAILRRRGDLRANVDVLIVRADGTLVERVR